MAYAQTALTAYLAKTYPNLSTHDIIKLIASRLTVGQIDDYLKSLSRADKRVEYPSVDLERQREGEHKGSSPHQAVLS
jgi:hypothetical protein